MNKKEDCTFWLSIVAMTISVVAVCVTLIRCESFDIDGLSLLVGISALVTTIKSKDCAMIIKMLEAMKEK